MSPDSRPAKDGHDTTVSPASPNSPQSEASRVNVNNVTKKNKATNDRKDTVSADPDLKSDSPEKGLSGRRSSENHSATGSSRGINTVSLQSTEDLWTRLAETLDEFYQAWEAGSPPSIHEFLPDSPLTLRKFAIVELVKVDIEKRLELHLQRRSLHNYAAEFPDLITRGKIGTDLLQEEIDLRRRYEESPTLEEYLNQFPDQRDAIEKLFGSDADPLPGRIFQKSATSGLKSGMQIDDFDLLLEIGKGAFATVFLARQLSMQRLVALKVSADHGDEPKTLAQLDCKNIVRVYDVRDIADPRCRLLYMKFVAGGTLQDVVRQFQDVAPEDRTGGLFLAIVDERVEKTGQDIPLDSRTRQRLLSMEWFEVVFWLGAQIADGLDYAHRRQVLHRDLKPANILLTTEGVPQIVDFNVSYCADVEGASAESFFGGSLAYMSPEQLEAFDPHHPREPGELTPASDLFSLGVILWELLLGERPFGDAVADNDFNEILKQLQNQRHSFDSREALEDRQAEWNVDSVGVFEMLLEPRPDRRIESARIVSGELTLLADANSRSLLRPAETRRHRWARKAIIPILIFAVVLPTLGAARFNYLYNVKSIIAPQGEQVEKTFENVQFVINAVAFPLGIGLLITLGWLLWSRTRINQRQRGDDSSRQEPSSYPVRRFVLRMPLISVIIPLSIWTLAGLAYPIAMNLAGASLTLADSFHFLTSLVLCGMIASIYPFFIIAHVAVRYWYPRVFVTHQISSRDIDLVERTNSRAWFFMTLAVLLPTFSILLMVTTQKENDRNLLAMLAGASFLGLGAVFVLFRKLQDNLETIQRCIRRITGINPD